MIVSLVIELISQLHTKSSMFEKVSLNNENKLHEFLLILLGCFHGWDRSNCYGKRSKIIVLPREII